MGDSYSRVQQISLDWHSRKEAFGHTKAMVTYMNDYLKRTWAEINLDNLNYNISQIKNKLSDTKVMAVVKADAYGHGDRFVARELVNRNGIDFVAVSSLAEALSLRNSGIGADILILGFTPVDHVDDLYDLHITQAIFSHEYAKCLNERAVVHGCRVNVHVKIDTGMGRIGFPYTDVEEIELLFSLPGLRVTGVFSHLSSADMDDDDSKVYTQMQVDRYDGVVSHLKSKGLQFLTHLQNSAGIAFVDGKYDMARAGIVLYGVPPSGVPMGYEVRPVMCLKSVISMVKELPPNSAVSYGRTFCTTKTTKVATVPIGYADGYPRLLSNKGEMLIRGQRAPIIGNICMDQLILDVTHIDGVQQDDVVTVVGTDGDETVSFWDLANKIGTLSYELMCLIGKRVPRVYYKGGERVAVMDWLANSELVRYDGEEAVKVRVR